MLFNGSNGPVASQTFETLRFQDGVTAAQSKAIAEALGSALTKSFNRYLTSTHFVFGPVCDERKSKSCRQNLNFKLAFKATTVDLDNDGAKEFIIQVIGPNECGSGGCTSYVLKRFDSGWKQIGELFGPRTSVQVEKIDGSRMRSIRWQSGSSKPLCVYEKGFYRCSVS